MSCLSAPRENRKALWELKHRVEAEFPEFPNIDVSAPEFSREAYLATLSDLFHAMEIPRSEITVSWKNISCTVPVDAPMASISDSLHNLRRSIRNGGGKVNNDEKRASFSSAAARENGVLPKTANVLDDVSGVVQPGSMCLVLGPSGCGSSLLLSRIASRPLGSNVIETGDVLYNGQERLHGIVKPAHFVQYVGQYDDHIPQITVRHTLEFAADCKWPDWLPHVEAIRHNDVILTARMLRIERTLDTIVGNNILRGVSGGERKRTTIAEMLIGMSSGCVVMDNWSKGLDSSTTLSITRSLREFSTLAQAPVITSMQAPGVDAFRMFDTVCVLDQGRVLYFGPREKAEQWFLDLGFQRPPQRSVPDFLATVANPDMRREYLPSQADLSGLDEQPPFTSEEFAMRFSNSAIADKVMQQVEHAEALKSSLDPATPSVFLETAQRDSLQRPKHQIKAIGKLYFRFHGATIKTLFNEIMENLLLGIILGSIFWQLPDSAGGASSRGGLIFLAVLFVGLSSLAKIEEKMKAKIVFAKQRYSAFYEAWPYILTLTFFDVAIELLRSLAFVVPLYIMSGLNLGGSAQRLLYAVLVETILSLLMIGAYRYIVAMTDDSDTAQGIAGMVAILLVLFAGFMKPPRELEGYIKWIYWINPLHYVFEALVLNEYDGLDLECKPKELRPAGLFDMGVPADMLDCPVTTGRAYLDEKLSITNEKVFRLYYFLVLIAYLVGMTILGAIGTARAKPKGHAHKLRTVGDVVELEQDNDIDATTIDLTSQPFAGKPNTRFSFANVQYAVDGGKKALLDGVSGFAVSGKVVLLMGESGAGKSTLLDVCAMRKTLGKGASVSGNIRLNGNDTSKELISNFTGYCEQNDIHIKEATVMEAVCFSAKLRLPENIPIAEKNIRAIETIDLLGLNSYSDMLVKTLGAGELKLLTMALEVVADPKVLFLDEPTSGISAASALVVANALRKIADTGTSVICTVHQPSKEVFSMFDRLLVLKRGGRQVYFGDIGEGGSAIRSYFESRGAEAMHEDSNPADWMLDVIADESKDYAEEWKNSTEKVAVDEEISKLEQPDEDADNMFSQPFKRVGVLVQMAEVMKRLFWRYWRLPEYNFTRVILMLVMALMVGVLFLRDVDDSQKGATLAFGAIFLSSIPSVLISQNVIPPTVDGRAVFYREVASGTYTPYAFHFALGLVEVPFTFVASTVFAVVFYFLVGLEASRFWYFFIAAQLLYYFSVAFGIVLAAVTPNAALAITIASSVNSVFNVLSGFFISKDALPKWWRWSIWVNPFFYYLAGVLQNQMEDREFVCKPEELQMFTRPENFASCEDLGFEAFNGGLQCKFCPIPNGDALIQAFGADAVNKYVALGALLGAIMICRVVAGFGLAKLRFLNR